LAKLSSPYCENFLFALVVVSNFDSSSDEDDEDDDEEIVLNLRFLVSSSVFGADSVDLESVSFLITVLL
jgi:hypothetical protein